MSCIMLGLQQQTYVAFKILTFLKANYLKYQVMEKLLNQVITKST